MNQRSVHLEYPDPFLQNVGRQKDLHRVRIEGVIIFKI